MPISKKIVAFDLDGTLSESKQEMTDEMAGMLLELSNSVDHIVVISGGSFEQFKKQFMSAISEIISKKPASLILLPVNGTERFEYDLGTKEWLMTDKEDLPENLKVKILAELQKIEQSGEYEIPSEKFGERVEERGTQITFSALGQQAPIERKKTWDPDQKKRLKIKTVLESAIPEISAVVAGMTSVDILRAGFDKSVGLRRLLTKMNLEISDMVFVGDSVFPGGNDYSPSQVGIETVSVASPTETINLIKNWLK